MRPHYLIATMSLLVLAVPSRSADGFDSATITLPAPRLDGEMSVEKALHDRRSLRDPSSSPLTLDEIGQLCWAAQGITDDKDHHTAPSAMAVYPLELYLIAGSVSGLAPGLYHYEPTSHTLRLVITGDLRAAVVDSTIGQEWIKRAPACFVITGVVARMTRMSERGRQFMDVEAGLAAQGFFLQATALGMGSTFVGGFDPEGIHAILGLPNSEEVLAVLPVGHKH